VARVVDEGFTFNFENEATDYETGTEFHFEWTIGYELSKGFIVGIVGNDLRPQPSLVESGKDEPKESTAPVKGCTSTGASALRRKRLII
jgi:hypothetical protein